MPYINSNNSKLYYEKTGNGPPLILISGFTTNHHVWDFFIQTLSLKYTTITFDNRGCGQSSTPKEPFSIEDMAHDVKNLMESLGIKKASILGSSMGGAIAMTFTHLFPERVAKLILVSAFPKKNAIGTFFFEILLKLFESGASGYLIRECILSLCLSEKFLQKKEAVKRLKGLIEEEPHPQPLLGFKNQLEALRHFDATDFIEKIQAKTLVIAAEKDLLTPLEGSKVLAEKIPKSTLKIIPDIGHAINIEKPEVLLGYILEFLS